VTHAAALQDRADTAQGSVAGFVTRCAANLLDGILLCGLWAGGLVMVGLVRFLARPAGGFSLPTLQGWVTGVAISALAIAYLTFGWSTTGRSIGKRVAGLRVVTTGGQALSAGRALWRASVCVVFPIGILWTLVSRWNRSLHDLVAGTDVVYDWGITIPSTGLE
jgi:uncharacterized RDD family membrane protein YckC